MAIPGEKAIQMVRNAHTQATQLDIAVTAVVAIVGGWWPAVVAAVLGTMLINWFFTPPTGMLLIHEPLNFPSPRPRS